MKLFTKISTEIVGLRRPDELLSIDNRLHSAFDHQDSDESSPDYTHQTKEPYRKTD